MSESDLYTEVDGHGYSMVIECCESYHASARPDGGRGIHIEVDPRFAALWLTKLSDLRATDEEIREHEPKPTR